MFTREEIDRARRYHRPLYAALALDAAMSLVLLMLLSFGSLGDGLYRPLRGLAWWAGALAFSGMIAGLSFLLQLPLSYWRGHVREKRWGFSTQTPAGWLADRAKGFSVGLVLTCGLLLGFIALARALHRTWPAVAAPAGAAVVLFLSFIAPAVLEPIFNRFVPLGDEDLAARLRALADRAGVPVRDVLVADASRRTRKENAYVSGLGRTRRVVVFDTLLARAEPLHVALVVAHELGHRRKRHVAMWTLLGMAGMVVAVTVLWILLRNGAVLGSIGAAGPGDPRVVPFLLLTGTALEFIGLPFQSALARRWETAADRFSLELTGALEVFEASHRDLAVANLSDLDPPRLLYLLLFTHPTPPERIADARRWAAQRGLSVRSPPTTR
jgi:STE24 endopeptidase